MFLAPRAGVGRLVDVLVESLQTAGTRFVTTKVNNVVANSGGGVIVGPEAGTFDAAVIATRAGTAAQMLGAETATSLAGIPTASVAVVTLALSGARLPAGINGFLVPRRSNRLITACSFASNKWPHWSEPGQPVVRLSVGRYGDHRALDLDDGTLTDRVVSELEEALGGALSVSASRVSRWPDTFPQYLLGHGDGIDRVEADLGDRLPGVALAGASYRGSGIPACIASGRRAARLVRQHAANHPVGSGRSRR